MKNRGRKKLIIYIYLICLPFIFITGCDRHTRYSVLTFFFTGVPSIDSDDALTVTGEKETTIKTKRQLKRESQQDVPSYAHGPFAAQQCNQCHSTASSATFRTSVKKISGTAGTKPGVSARLILPSKELCIDCHTTKSISSAFNKGLWIHGPVSEGICTACHSPHQSPYQYMLLNGNASKMCTGCHAKGFITETENHLNNKNCTSCHNPHVGKNRFLLKKDFDEAF